MEGAQREWPWKTRGEEDVLPRCGAWERIARMKRAATYQALKHVGYFVVGLVCILLWPFVLIAVGICQLGEAMLENDRR